MADLKLMQKVASVLRQSDHYVKNKKSTFSNRFDFTLNKENGEIEIFNAEKGNDLFLWADFCIGVAAAFSRPYYLHIDTYGSGKLSFHMN